MRVGMTGDIFLLGPWWDRAHDNIRGRAATGAARAGRRSLPGGIGCSGRPAPRGAWTRAGAGRSCGRPGISGWTGSWLLIPFCAERPFDRP